MNLDITEKTLATYDQIARSYTSINYEHDYWKSEFEIFRKIVPSGKIIDIGCGGGRDANLFLSHGYDYLGIDGSKEMLNQAQITVPDAHFELRRFDQLNFSDSSLDGFWAAASLLHVDRKDIQSVLNSIYRILKLGSGGFISIKEKNNLDEEIVAAQAYNGGERFFSYYTLSEFQKILELAGFEVRETSFRVEEDQNKPRWICYYVTK